MVPPLKQLKLYWTDILKFQSIYKVSIKHERVILTKPFSQPAVDSLGCSIVGGVRRVNSNSVLQSSNHQALLPGFPGYALHGSENRRMVGENEISFLSQCLFHHFLSQVIG